MITSGDKSDGKNKDAGVATILVVGVLAGFLIYFFVLAIDFAYIYVVRGQVQNAADAAAFAGAVKLPDANAARIEAMKFAAKNKAAGEPVTLDMNISNDSSGDIVTGFWDGTDVDPAGFPVNAIRVVARKAGDDSVRMFFGGIIGRESMEVAQVAVAYKPPLTSAPIPMCVETCVDTASVTPLNPRRYVLNEQTLGVVNAIAWSDFTQNANTPLGPHSTVAQYLRRELIASNICGTCITSNNGIGQAFNIFIDMFEDINFDVDNKDATGWTVVVPILSTPCATPGLSACPPGNQSVRGEPFLVEQLAKIHITNIEKHGVQKGIDVDSIQCLPCGSSELLGTRPVLVK